MRTLRPNYSNVHPLHALRQCVEYIDTHHHDMLVVEFSDKTRTTQIKFFIIYMIKSTVSDGMLTVSAVHDANYHTNSQFTNFVPKIMREFIRTQQRSPEDIMRLFNSMLLDDTPMRLRSINISVRSHEITMYRLADDEPCAMEESVRQVAARKITRAAATSACVARMHTRRTLRTVLEELMFAPPGMWNPSFQGGAIYLDARRSFFVNTM
jgi:hypothetical protein